MSSGGSGGITVSSNDESYELIRKGKVLLKSMEIYDFQISRLMKSFLRARAVIMYLAILRQIKIINCQYLHQEIVLLFLKNVIIKKVHGAFYAGCIHMNSRKQEWSLAACL